MRDADYPLLCYCGGSGTCGGAWLWCGRGLSLGCADGTGAACCRSALCETSTCISQHQNVLDDVQYWTDVGLIL